MIWVLVPCVVVMWMVGGQFEKGVRRFGIPGTVTLVAFIEALLAKEAGAQEGEQEKQAGWKGLLFLLMIPVLAMGYGVNSAIMRVCQVDWLVRIVYASLLAGVLDVEAIVTHDPWWLMVLYHVVLPAAFSVRAGSLGKVGKWDVLAEDIIRGTSVGVCVVLGLQGGVV